MATGRRNIQTLAVSGLVIQGHWRPHDGDAMVVRWSHGDLHSGVDEKVIE
jgi:hypothetical protein